MRKKSLLFRPSTLRQLEPELRNDLYLLLLTLITWQSAYWASALWSHSLFPSPFCAVWREVTVFRHYFHKWEVRSNEQGPGQRLHNGRGNVFCAGHLSLILVVVSLFGSLFPSVWTAWYLFFFYFVYNLYCFVFCSCRPSCDHWARTLSVGLCLPLTDSRPVGYSVFHSDTAQLSRTTL